MASHSTNGSAPLATRILPVSTKDLGRFADKQTLETWELPTDLESLGPLQEAATHLRNTNTPVGFPTETVYGLGADATRSEAVKGIYKAKGRPSDNPLIIHVCDLTMLRSLTSPASLTNGNNTSADQIPAIYKPLIERFWPGPLTILLPNPNPSKLAPEVTAGLPTFGARMPDSPLALSLIHLAGVPLAAPSANASTKPSPTTAQHVQHDLEGKIEIILDGGPCLVGVESTVVDGLCAPPVVLRPGGVSIDSIRECEGWSDVVKGYKDASEIGSSAPRAPGMKYKHYSPKAKVILYEAIRQKDGISFEVEKILEAKANHTPHFGYEALKFPVTIGVVRTKHWQKWGGLADINGCHKATENSLVKMVKEQTLETQNSFQMVQGELWQEASKSLLASSLGGEEFKHERIADVIEISLGLEIKDIAHGLFSSLRELDQRGADVIYVEGIEDEGDIAAAVMNRLRKAASVIET